MVFDRGLPVANLNNAAGDAKRSNVRWGGEVETFVGDDLRLGAPGERWVIDRIRTWAVPGNGASDPAFLGDNYQELRLYFGSAATALAPVVTGRLAPGGNGVEQAAVAITEATRDGTPLYDDFGKFLKVWQIDFNHLNLAVDGGALYRFGVKGTGRYGWFNHGSNAALGESRQDGADGKLHEFDAAGNLVSTFDSATRDWNKPSDLNVQVFAHLDVDVVLEPHGRVTVLGRTAFDTGAVDVASLRFGKAAPSSYKLSDVNGDGTLDLTVQFPGALRGCLTGQRLDGTPFAGCGR